MRDLESTNVEAAARLARDAEEMPPEPAEAVLDQCDVAGHDWADAGGGLLVCLRCETERWADEIGPLR